MSTVQPTDTSGCEQEGAYPAVRQSTGDVYVGYEYNWVTNYLGNPACVNSAPTLVVVTEVPQSCLPDPDSAPLVALRSRLSIRTRISSSLQTQLWSRATTAGR